ncbi:hypothetical protein [Bradyrhizobium sp. AS23.2]|uniref:hypothetical protein n=1 Tax=Bradyrhizobium sp. AS23.2 TaxID=1680155 RepID=UPI001FD966D1|nr:hypothetical protein [Bradyrhizobium sp. AS23.2]
MGRLVALLYLFCVLAPGAALALGSGPAPCFDDLPAAMVHAHDAAASADHSHAGTSQHHDHLSDASNAGGHGHGKSGPGPCCAMLCVPAIPTNILSVVTPVQHVSICSVEADRSLRGEAPARLYRPPHRLISKSLAGA